MPSYDSKGIYAVLASDSSEELSDTQSISSNMSDTQVDEDNAIEPENQSSRNWRRLAYTDYDLIELEHREDKRPLYTPSVLKRAAKDIQYVLSEQAKPDSKRDLGTIHYPQTDDTEVKIWEPKKNADMVMIYYMNRVELNPDFRRRFGNTSTNLSHLFNLNDELTDAEKVRIHAPYTLSSKKKFNNNAHKNKVNMVAMRKYLLRTQQLWEKSGSRQEICSRVLLGAADTTPITKILCMGLGELRNKPGWYGSTLQHLCVFSLANELDAFNKKQDPKCPPVTIIAQDPFYTERDFIVLQELASRPIDFSMSNPEALLAIDENTLIVTAYLPTSVPLMQIIADLFYDNPEKGPAMMICDKMDLNLEKREYCYSDRDSPKVARFLRGSYLSWPRPFSDLDSKVKKHINPKFSDYEVYWLTNSQLFVRNV